METVGEWKKGKEIAVPGMVRVFGTYRVVNAFQR